VTGIPSSEVQIAGPELKSLTALRFLLRSGCLFFTCIFAGHYQCLAGHWVRFSRGRLGCRCSLFFLGSS